MIPPTTREVREAELAQPAGAAKAAVARIMPDPVAEPTLSVERGGRILGVGRGTAYAAVHSGAWPAVRIGRRIVLPTARWLEAVGLAGPGGP